MTVYQQIASNRRRTYLLITLFVIVIIGLSYVFSEALDTGLGLVGIAGVGAIFSALFSFFGGDKVALLTSGAHGPIKKEDSPYAYRMVENLSIASGLPMPKVYIIDDPMMNAFATGRDPKHASIALTTGLIKGLENEELEGVIAHELSHVKNEDIKLMMVVLVLVGTIALMADFFLRSRWIGGNKRNEGAAYFLLLGLVLAIFSPIAAQLIKLAVSRQREYMADASGVLMTRFPEGLANALEKIDKSNTQPLKHANNAMAHLYIANPFGTKKRFLTNLFSTHPPIADRIKKLHAM
jgi:heat shock protein HtpX